MRGFGRRAAMPSALSVDLRERVVGAIEQGASRRQAAKRFGVSPASAIRWHEGFVQQGRLTPKPQGGDQRSHRIEAHAALILQTCEAYPQIFLRELRDALQEQGVEVSTSSLSRFFARHAITRKKGRRTRLSRSGRT
jgi:transposase